MINGTVVLFSRDTNGKKFSRKCLKQIAKDNKGKVCKIAQGDCIVHNIRYRWGKVIAEVCFPLHDINTTGKIQYEYKGKVNVFEVDKIEMIRLETK